MNRGVLLVAHGRQSYWEEACTLARSIRVTSPNTVISVASDLGVPEPTWRAAGFDAYMPYDFRECSRLTFKMHLDRITPFTDTTLFIDSDSICYRNLDEIFDAYSGHDFVTLGRNVTESYWFRDSARLRRDFCTDAFPFFCGDFYLFRKSSRAKQVFESAREVMANYDALGINPECGHFNDEPCFSLAMVQHGLTALPGRGRWIAHFSDPSFADQRIDFSREQSQIMFDGVSHRCAILHFGVFRTQPIYFREKYRVHAAAPPSALTDACAYATGHANSFVERAWRRLARVSKRRTKMVTIDSPPQPVS